MEEKNKIGDFFKTQLSDYQSEVSLLEYEVMNAKIAKNSFMTFQARQFNVYYAAAIFSGFFISLLLGGHYLGTYKTLETELAHTRQELALIQQQVNRLQHLGNRDTTAGDTSSPKIKTHTHSISKGGSAPSESRIVASKPNGLTQESSKVSEPEKVTPVQTPHPQASQEGQHTQATPTPSQTPPTVVPSPQSKAKQKVIIYKRDTIYQYDTLKVKKKRK